MDGGHSWLQILLLLDDIYWLVSAIWQVFILPEFKSWSSLKLLQHNCHFLKCRNSHELAMKGQRNTSWIHPTLLCSHQLTKATCGLLEALNMPCFRERSSRVPDDDLTGSRGSWREGLTHVNPKSGARKPVPSPGSSLARGEEPKEGHLWLWPANLSRRSSIWRTTGCELVPMQLICQARGIWKATEWITDPQPATHCLAQAWCRQ